MVKWPWDSYVWLDGALLAQQKAQTVLSRLDPARRVKVLAALAGLIILGFGLVALVWLGGRFTRRYMNSQSRPFRDPARDEEDWASMPIAGKEDASDGKESEPV